MNYETSTTTSPARTANAAAVARITRASLVLALLAAAAASTALADPGNLTRQPNDVVPPTSADGDGLQGVIQIADGSNTENSNRLQAPRPPIDDIDDSKTINLLSDINHDGGVDAADFTMFIDCFMLRDAALTPEADIVGGDGNPPGDGQIDGNDFMAFLNAFGARS